MELDKRIKALTDIQSVTDGCHDWQFMTKKGYFANSIFDFKELKRFCVYGEYAGWREHNQCFLCEWTGDQSYYSYFIPEENLLPEEKPEKKYREYKDLDEFFDVTGLEIGDLIKLKFPGNNVAELLIVGGCNNGLFIGIHKYTFKQLFEIVEISISGEWQPFGVIDEEGVSK